jgi:peptidoglycan/xylan/chitin deacetylase (PgdA/CDA1 family)
MVYLLFHDVYANDPRESGFSSPAADRYKLTVDRFDRELAALAALPSSALPFTLTFDDGGESFYTVVADRLETHGWRAHCYVATDYIDRPGFLTRNQLRDLHRRGHLIGSHSASHPERMHACARDMISREWLDSVASLEDVLGVRVDTASVPGGCYSAAVAEAAAGAGIVKLFTSQPARASHRASGCRVQGRFTIRHHSTPELSARVVAGAPWSRWGMWAQWNAKAAIKPLLGPIYPRVADWLMAQHGAQH